MFDELKINIDRLVREEDFKIEASLSPSFIGVSEESLSFSHPIEIEGVAYLASDHLVINCQIKTIATKRCSICNQEANISIEVPEFYHTEELELIKNAMFDCSDKVRESILLEVPPFIECTSSGCPERCNLNRYFTTNTNSSEEKEKDEVNNFPFSNLE